MQTQSKYGYLRYQMKDTWRRHVSVLGQVAMAMRVDLHFHVYLFVSVRIYPLICHVAQCIHTFKTHSLTHKFTSILWQRVDSLRWTVCLLNCFCNPYLQHYFLFHSLLAGKLEFAHENYSNERNTLVACAGYRRYYVAEIVQEKQSRRGCLADVEQQILCSRFLQEVQRILQSSYLVADTAQKILCRIFCGKYFVYLCAGKSKRACGFR